MAESGNSIEARFEGFEIVDHGVAQTPNLLFKHYTRLGMKDGHFTLISHLISRKWSEAPPFPALTHIPMSANVDTRRRYVRELRNSGLLFTARLYWFKEDVEKYPYAKPGKVRANIYYLGSLLHNLTRMEQWIEEGNDAKDFVIEIPMQTVKLFVAGELNDTPEKIANLINEMIDNGSVMGGGGCSLPESLLCEKRIVDDGENDLLCEKQVLEKRIVMNKNHLNKEVSNNKDIDLFVNPDLPVYDHDQLADAWGIYYRPPGTDNFIQAVVKKVTPKRLKLNIEGVGVKLVVPDDNVFYLNGGPGLNRVVVAEVVASDGSSEGLPAEVLAMKNKLIDLIKPDNTFKVAAHIRVNQMKEIQDTAFEMVNREVPLSDLGDFDLWWKTVSYPGKKGNPVTLKALYSYWKSAFKPWQEEQNQAKENQALAAATVLARDTREVLTPEAVLLDSLQGVLKTMVPTACQNLFSDLVPVGEDNNILIVSVPKPGNLEWIENRYQEVVSRAAHQVRADLSVRFVCEAGDGVNHGKN